LIEQIRTIGSSNDENATSPFLPITHTIEFRKELRQEMAAKTGENIRIARFSYFKVGGE